jgi:hypothetical protein
MTTEDTKRNLEIMQAIAESPGMEIGAAYKKWKEARGEKAEKLLSSNTNKKKEIERLSADARRRERPCTDVNCNGRQRLTPVCSSCTEGKAGYKTQWICGTCGHRDLSKEDMTQWMTRFYSV